MFFPKFVLYDTLIIKVKDVPLRRGFSFQWFGPAHRERAALLKYEYSDGPPSARTWTRSPMEFNLTWCL